MINVGKLVLCLEENGIEWDFALHFSFSKNFRKKIIKYNCIIIYIYIS